MTKRLFPTFAAALLWIVPGDLAQAQTPSQPGLGAPVVAAVSPAMPGPAAPPKLPPPPTTFEVASIKPVIPDPEKMRSGQQHRGMKVEGKRVEIGAVTLSELICMAYRIKYYQLEGPRWLTSGNERFDIVAKIAPTNRLPIPELLQALLAERFQLTIHRSQKETKVLALVVGKNGVKMIEAPADPATQAPTQTPGSAGAGPQPNTPANTPPPAASQKVSFAGGVAHIELARTNMASLVGQLSRFVPYPLVDSTNLQGFYRVALDISQEDMRNAASSLGVAMRPPDAPSEPGPSVLTSLHELGLDLQTRKVPLDLIVVDRVEKMPTDN